MIDPDIIRSQPDMIEQALESRAYPVSFLSDYISKDKEWRNALQLLEKLQQQRNAQTPKGKPTPDQIKALGELSQAIKEKQSEYQDLSAAVKEAALLIPNHPQKDVPVGVDESDNEEVKVVGTPTTFDFTPKPHDELGERHQIFRFEYARKISGSRFSVLMGRGAKLHRALEQFMLDTHTENGYTEVVAPLLINTDSLIGTGQLPKFQEDQYHIEDLDLWLSPTAEVQLTNLHRESILKESDLPIKLTAQTNCFRKEAGSYGKDMKGLIRQHQFSKVELVQFVKAEDSEIALESLLSDAERILSKLELPYRIVKLCTGDLGFSAAKTYDLEVWMPSQNCYREISSCSNFLDFQARRAMIRYKCENGRVSYIHTLNGSGLAVGRTLAAILENYQEKDGTIRIPEALIPYTKMEAIA